ncbi:MAG TPA: TlpA family protein disulfide reductase [Rhodobacterales bacterium]|nr:TlpA family protein disulfide reductase [Rhodobacterales bacterium]
MRLIFSALLYAALTIVANPAVADVASAVELRAGDMRKLNFHSEPKAVGQAAFKDPEGGEHVMADYQGQVVLLNFWATWCPPCRKEMPTLEALQVALGGEDFQVVTIATGRNQVAAIQSFFDSAGVEHLPILLDRSSELARSMGVRGLPTTILIDRAGNEIARLTGDADWASESALAVIGAVMDADPAAE